ncbi:surface carbohydrate biosynthesis protein [Dongia sp. agr-C8]
MEIASRELDSRLLLSVIALTYGFEVVIGQKWLIESNIRRMPGGIYLSKTMTRRDAESLAKARARGYFPAAIDEEMPGLVTKPEELRWIAPEAVEQSEAIFIAGEGNTQSFMARFPAAKAKVHMALNPRWDLLRSTLRSMFDEEVAQIRGAYGDFILVNTNQGFTNSEKGSKDDILREQVRLGKIDPANTEHMAYVNSIVEMENANKAAVIEVVAGLRKAHPDRTLVIRPHPSERIATWTEAFPGDARIKVIREGSAVPWILASTLLVHTNCTTGTEAIALGKPAICVMPLDNAICQRYLSNRVNPVARSVEETLALAERILSGSVASLYTPQMVDTFHHAMSFEDDRLGAQIIIEQLVNAVERREAFSAPGSASSWRPDQNYRWHIPDKNVRAELFPSLDREAVVRRLQKIAKALGIDLMPEVEYCGSKVLLISNHRMAPFVRFRRSLAGAFYDFRTGT